jgi:hypothetical protein
MFKEAVVAYLKLLMKHLLLMTEEKGKEFHSVDASQADLLTLTIPIMRQVF